MEKENYTKVPNEIFEALAKTKLSNYELRYIWVLLRKTYGWNKISEYISNSQFVKETGIKKYHIWRTEKRLLWRKIVTKRGNKLSFNTNYGEWKELPIVATVTKLGIKVTNRGKKVTNRGGHKEHLTKKKKQRKENSLSSNFSSLKETEDGNSTQLHNDIIGFFKKKTEEEWEFTPEIRKKDLKVVKEVLGKYEIEQIKEIIEWYLGNSKKVEEFGANLSIALSGNSINLYFTQTGEKQRVRKKPYFWNKPMWKDENGKWFVIYGKNDFREFAGKEEDIEWK